MDQLGELAALVGAANVITGDDAQGYLTDWRGRYSGSALAVVRPGSTQEVAARRKHQLVWRRHAG